MDYNNGNNLNNVNDNQVDNRSVNYQTFNNPSVSTHQANNNFDMPV